jgi:hypothetical protein
MASTTNYGWTTPDDSNYVKDGASAIRTLGSAIDSTLKTQIDAQIPDSLLTTTGDVIYASGASTPARLGIGTNGQVLGSNGTTPVWTNAVGTDAVLTQETATQYIKNLIGSSEVNATANTTYYMPIFLPTFSADRIGIRTGSTAGGANGNVRLGLYNVSATTGKPTTVVFDAGTVSVTAASTDFQITITQNITAGWYYLAFNNQGSTTWRIAAGGTPVTGTYPAPSFAITATGLTNANPITGFTESSITGAFTTAGTLSTLTTVVPIVGMRIA